MVSLGLRRRGGGRAVTEGGAEVFVSNEVEREVRARGLRRGDVALAVEEMQEGVQCCCSVRLKAD